MPPPARNRGSVSAEATLASSTKKSRVTGMRYHLQYRERLLGSQTAVAEIGADLVTEGKRKPANSLPQGRKTAAQQQ